MSDKDGWDKNWDVVKKEAMDYRVQIAVVMVRVRRAQGWKRKLHHLSGLGPDIHRFMPRTLWYARVIAGVLSVLVVLGVLAVIW